MRITLFIGLVTSGASYLLAGCNNPNQREVNTDIPLVNAEQRLHPILDMPKKGEVIAGRISDDSNILDALNSYSETEFKGGTLESVSKLKSKRQEYLGGQLGSGAIFAFSPKFERDYEFSELAGSKSLAITLPSNPKISLTCEGIAFDENYSKRCTSENAFYEVSLAFKPITKEPDLSLILDADILNNNPSRIKSLYFVKFKLPEDAANLLKPHSSNRTEKIGRNTFATYEQTNYFLRSTIIIGGNPPQGQTKYNIYGQLAGVGFYDSDTGKIIALTQVENANDLK